MASKHQALLLSFVLLFSSAVALDVKAILNPYTEFSTFTKYLVDTKLVDEIDSRQTITVLVVDNAAAAPFSSLPADKLKNALSVHVLLDYYDPYIFDRNLNKSAQLTTLFQASGQAQNGAGFINFKEMPGERMMFGSAVAGAPLDSELLKVVGARPYNLSVLQVSKAIVPPGIGSAAAAPATPPPAAANRSSPAAPVAALKASPATPAEAPKTSPSTPAAAAAPKAGAATAPAAAPKAGAATVPAAAPKASSTTPSAESPKSSAAAHAKAPTTGPAAAAKAPKASAATPAAAPKSSSAAPADAPAEGPEASEAPDSSHASAPSADAPAESADVSAPVVEAPVGEETEKHSSSAGRVVAGEALGLVMGAAVLLGAL